jgi:hypothetical protein
MQFLGGGGSSFADRVFVADGDTDFDTLYTEFTFAAWVKPSAATEGVDQFIAGKMGGSGQRGWQLYRQNATESLVLDYFETNNNAPVQGDLTVSTAFTVGTWTHVAFTFKANEFVKMYVDGVLKLDQTSGVLATLNGSNSAAFQVGNRGNSINSSWVGWIDDARVYNNVLTDAEIAALATVSQPHAGDFDLDGDVDGADFVAWQTNFPKESGATRAEGDADGDGDVDGADFVVWQTNFPFTPGPGAAPVPEPQTFLLLGIGSVLALVSRRKLVY